MVEKEIKEESGLSLIDIWNILIRHIWIIIVCVFVGGAGGGVYGYVLKDPTYISDAKVMIQVDAEAGSNADINNGIVVGLRISQTVAELMQSRKVAKLVANEVLGDVRYYPLIQSGLNVSPSTTSLMIPVSYVSTDKDNVKAILNSVIEQTIALANDDNQNYTALKDKITVVDDASEAKYNSPNKTLLLLVGLVIGGVLGVVIAFILELINDKVMGKSDIEEKIGIKCIGSISDFTMQNK